MPRKKTAAPAPAETVETVEAVVTAPAAEAAPAEVAPVEAAPAPVEAAPAKKTRKPRTPKAAPKAGKAAKAPKAEKAAPRRGRPPLSPEVYVEFSGKQYEITNIVEKAKADYRTTHKVGVQSCKIYIKPEEGMAYYVINKVSGKFEL